MADPLFRNLTEVLDEGERTGDLYTAVPVLKERLSRMVRTKKLSYERVTTFTDFARERYGLNIELDADLIPKPDTMPMEIGRASCREGVDKVGVGVGAKRSEAA